MLCFVLCVSFGCVYVCVCLFVFTHSVTNSSEIETYLGCCDMLPGHCGTLPGAMLFLHSLFVSVSYRLKYLLHLESSESGGALKNFDCEKQMGEK